MAEQRRSTPFPYTTLFRSRPRGRGPGCRGTRHCGWRGSRSWQQDLQQEVGGGGGEQDRVHPRSEEHTSELQSRGHLVCRLLLGKKKKDAQDPLRIHISVKV